VVFSQGADVLHISAHADDKRLALENPDGAMDPMSEAGLLHLLRAGGGLQLAAARVRLVVVAACRSKWAALAFVTAGAYCFFEDQLRLLKSTASLLPLLVPTVL
jgi:hypothetical protein